LLNIHEDLRNTVVVAWMPILDEDISDRPGQGYECSAARNVRLQHQCWNRYLSRWPEHSEHARVVI
jgi:hypothetical protein